MATNYFCAGASVMNLRSLIKDTVCKNNPGQVLGVVDSLVMKLLLV